MAINRKNAAKRVLIAFIIAVAALIAFCAWYVNDYYHADSTALAVVEDEDGASDGVVVSQLDSGALFFAPDKPIAGLVFYPGAKVQPEAYAPLMERLADRGVLCVLVKPLFNLAILDANAADGVIVQFPNVDRWIIAGHSMGGVAASDYLARHTEDFEGIVLLASYTTADLAGSNVLALSIVGSDDGVLNRDNYAAAQEKLPASAIETVIEGGNHAYFGNYGEQAGDGRAAVSRESQQEQTAQAIVALLGA